MSDWVSFRPPGTPHPFALAIASEQAVFVSGLSGHHPETGELPDDVPGQARQAMLNLKASLEASGSSLDEVVWFHPYVAEREYALEMDEVIKEFVGEVPPASGALVVCDLAFPGMRLEFEAVAVKGARRVAHPANG